jgi:hypothetical protein
MEESQGGLTVRMINQDTNKINQRYHCGHGESAIELATARGGAGIGGGPIGTIHSEGD